MTNRDSLILSHMILNANRGLSDLTGRDGSERPGKTNGNYFGKAHKMHSPTYTR